MPNLDPNIITPESVALYYSKARLLLDKVPGAAAAYSLRQLSSAYNGPVVRVREDDGDTEQDFTAKQITDGTLLDFCDGNSGFVVTWYDQSGNERDATQTTTGDQPRIVNNGVLEELNNKPAVSALLQNQLLSAGVQQMVNPSDGSWSAFGVVMYTDIETNTVFAGNDGETRVAQMLRVRSGGTGNRLATIQFGIPDGVYTLNSTSDGFIGQQILQTAISPQNSQHLFVNGAAEGSFTQPNPNRTNADGFNIFGRGRNRGDGDMIGQEIIIFPNDQTANRTLIESNQAAHYGITLAS